MIARVATDRALDRVFDYLVPAELEGRICVGAQVVVPFGRGSARGFVLALAEASEVAADKLKPLGEMVGEEALIPERLLALARWMAGYYMAPIEHCLRTVLPGAVRREGAGFREQWWVRLREDAPLPESLRSLGVKQRAAWDWLRGCGGVATAAEVAAGCGATLASLRGLAKRGVVELEQGRVERRPEELAWLPSQPLVLNEEQAAAMEVIGGAMEKSEPGVVLLFGVTGSGKTEVFLQAIQRVLDRGQGAIMLVPEISLTSQTAERFRSRFGDKVALLHSHLSEGERHDAWHRIRGGEARVVVGARSALFSPVPDLGLIVVDEEHEVSYKQDESPRYQARDMAVLRGKLEGCAVVLGSATPSIESWNNVVVGKYGLARMERRVDDQQMPHVRVVDLKLVAAKEGGPQLFSQDLIEAVRDRLARQEQVILFLNRRGFSTSLACPGCGYVVECAWCSIAMTWHRSEDRLRCHVCGDARGLPERCPECGSGEIRKRGTGTEKLEDRVGKLFKGARVLRVDSDTMTRKDAYRQFMLDFRSGRIDIVIGTQMIAKGLHFPNVTLVGVINADSTLHMPDFRAAERTFQLITQVAGRAGRGDVAGEVIVQTWSAFDPAIQAARRLAFGEFVDQEMAFRREMAYPPFGHLVCVTGQGGHRGRVLEAMRALVDDFRGRIDADRVACSDVFAASIERMRGNFRFQFTVRAGTTLRITQPLREALLSVSMPRGVKVAVDVDAYSMR